MSTENIAGFQKKDFVTPEAVLGSDIRIEELPDGIRFYLKGQAVNLAEKRIVVRLYEKIQVEGGAKLRLDPLEKFINRIPEDEEIALRYGPNDKAAGSEGYMWIAKWKDIAGSEKGILSETIWISEKWRARYEAAQRKAAGAESLPAPSSAAPASPSGVMTPMDMLKVLQEGEDRAFRNMERMANIFKGANGQAPESVMVKAYEAAGSIMERAMESNLNMGKKVAKVVERRMEDEDEPGDGAAPEGDDGAADPLAGVPGFIRPFLPQLETWLGTLIGGGPMAAAAKTLIVNSAQWKEIFNDPDKWGQAVAAMENHFGSERTEKAMDVLLNRRAPKGPVKGAAKGKGK